MRSLLLLLTCFVSFPVYASHIFGGELTYKYVGPPAKYEITLTLYVDCELGLPDAISQDAPVYINFFNNSDAPLFVDPSGNPYFDSIWLESRTTIINSSADVCNTDKKPEVCLQKVVFKKTYYLPSASAAYTAVVQRCCRTASIVNIDQPANTGSTFYATIQVNGKTNNAAIFKNDPLYFIHINTPLVYDASATDADGDSLSYEFCTAYKGGSNNDAKPVPTRPPFTPVVYTAPFSYSHPITSSPQIQIDPVTGIISGTPTVLGRYLLVVCCHEWRNGVNINTTRREMQLVTTDCTHGIELTRDSAQKELHVYVSSFPSSAIISFAASASNIIIFDMTGRVIYRSDITDHQNSVKIPTASWSKGVYIARLTYPKLGNISTKFVLH